MWACSAPRLGSPSPPARPPLARRRTLLAPSRAQHTRAVLEGPVGGPGAWRATWWRRASLGTSGSPAPLPASSSEPLASPAAPHSPPSAAPGSPRCSSEPGTGQRCPGGANVGASGGGPGGHKPPKTGTGFFWAPPHGWDDGDCGQALGPVLSAGQRMAPPPQAERADG